MKTYRSLEGTQAAVDTKTQLTTRGVDGTTVITVPAGATKLEALIVALGWDFVAAGSAAALVRLEGDGITGGNRVVTVGAAAQEGTTGGQHLTPARVIPLGKQGVKVVAGNTIEVYGEMVGEDIGSVEFCVTLVFS